MSIAFGVVKTGRIAVVLFRTDTGEGYELRCSNCHYSSNYSKQSVLGFVAVFVHFKSCSCAALLVPSSAGSQRKATLASRIAAISLSCCKEALFSLLVICYASITNPTTDALVTKSSCVSGVAADEEFANRIHIPMPSLKIVR